MKIIAPLGLGTFALLTGLLSIHLAVPAPAAPPAPSAEPVALRIAVPVAVVELFTSEGCSSCPPADALLLDLAERGDPRLLPLAFHVDYWNRLGWRDPFSDAAYSQRQRAYARAFGSDRVYTPQMVVNGRREFVGSRRLEAERAIQQALEASASATVEVAARVAGRTVTVDYAVTGAPDDAVLHLALVQRRAEQAVPRGENAGRTLRHANVVRAFETVSAGMGTQPLTLPRGLRSAEASIVGFAQDPATMHVFGASEVAVNR